MDTCFILKNMSRVERHITMVFVLRDLLLASIKLKEVIELQYHSKHHKVSLFKCYWYDTIDRGITVDSHHGLVEN